MPLEIRAAVAAQKCPEPKPFRTAGGAAAFTAAAGEGDAKKLGTFKGCAYTGQPMTPEGWWTPVVIDLAGVRGKQSIPALRQHDHEQIVGHTSAVTVTGTGIDVEGVLSGQAEHVDKVLAPGLNGFPWQMSVGASPLRTEYLESGEDTQVNGRTVTGPLVISRETEVGEVSFVPLGADGDTSATVSASRGSVSMNNKALLKFAKAQGVKAAQQYSDEDIDKMSDDEAKAALKKCMKNDADTDAAEGDDEEDEGEKPAKASKGGKGSITAAGLAKKATEDAIAAARASGAAEVERQDAIRAAVAKHGVTHVTLESGEKVHLLAHAIKAGWSTEKAELHALRAGRPSAGVGNGPLVFSTSTPEASEAVLEAAVLHAMRHQFKLEDNSFYEEATPDGKGVQRRVPLHLQRQAQGEIKARYTDQVQQSAHSLFKGRITLKQVLTLAAQGAGIGRHFDLSGEEGVRDYMRAWGASQDIRAEGASNVSISNVLSNVLNKFSLQGYLFTEQAWRAVAAIRPVNDFKPTKSINLLGDVQYKKLGPSGELENASLGDQAFANQVDPYGRILTIPWTHFVNDDLGILGTVPQKIGQGAGLALNDVFWKLWGAMAAGSVNGDDAQPFWRTTSSVTPAAMKNGTAYRPNKLAGAGSALSAAALKAAKALFDNQIDPNGNPLGFDGLTPVLLHGPSNWQDATALMQAAAIVYGGATGALQPDKNVWQGMMQPVMSRYIENPNYVNSATAFWLLFAPFALAAIEVAFLNGVDTPTVLQAGPDYQFDKLGMSIRGTMPFGVNAQNFRGGVYSVGA